MIELERYFPFLSKSSISNTSEKQFDLTSDRLIKLEPNDRKIDLEDVLSNKPLRLVRIMPNNLYVADPRYPNQAFISNADYSSYDGDTLAHSMIVTFDYGALVQTSTSRLDDTHVSMSVGDAYATAEVSSMQYYEDALNDTESSSIDLINNAAKEVAASKAAVTKAAVALGLPDTSKFFGDESPEVLENTPKMTVIENYLVSTEPTEKIPLLVGMSGMTKSAIVKDMADKLGMRLVDLRVSFMSRLDIDGLCDIVDKESGNPFSVNAPMNEFITCTDEFLEFARSVLILIDNKLEDPNLTADELVRLNEARAKYEYYTKTPILFFDEITRSDRSIRGALTTIINQRLYGRFHLNEARMIAATNAPVGYEDDDDMMDLFLNADMTDVAVLDRFNKVIVEVEDVRDNWLEWAKTNIHPIVLEYLEFFPNKIYDITPAVQKAHEYDRADDMIPPYPTFRAWDNISDYLKSLDAKNTKEYNYNIFVGLLGDDTAQAFKNFITSNYDYTDHSDVTDPIELESEDKMTKFVEDSLDSGLPTMLVGVSGLGKTTRVREYAEKNGYHFELIALSTKDRLDIMGPPAKIGIDTYISKDTSGIFDELGMTTQIKDLIKQADLPENLTVRAPKEDFKQRIQHCIETNTPVVVMYDEVNRSPDPTVQSAIFQAISDNSICGVKFPKGLVKVVIAGNLGDSTNEAGALDGALTARAVQFSKMEYDEDDAKAVLNYMKSHEYAEPLIDYFENGPGNVLDCIKSVDEGSLTNNVPSTRALSELSNFLKSDSISKQINGRVLFIDDAALIDYNIDKSYDSIKSVATIINRGIDKWAAIGSYNYSKDIPLEQAVSIFKESYEYIMNNDLSGMEDNPEVQVFLRGFSKVIDKFIRIDNLVKVARYKIFECYIGKSEASQFADHYNSYTGAGLVVTIPDLIDPALRQIFVINSIRTYPHWSDAFIEVYNYHELNTLSSRDYAKLLKMFVLSDDPVNYMEHPKSELRLLLTNSNIVRLIETIEEESRTKQYDEYLELFKKLSGGYEYTFEMEYGHAHNKGVIK